MLPCKNASVMDIRGFLHHFWAQSIASISPDVKLKLTPRWWCCMGIRPKVLKHS